MSREPEPRPTPDPNETPDQRRAREEREERERREREQRGEAGTRARADHARLERRVPVDRVANAYWGTVTQPAGSADDGSDAPRPESPGRGLRGPHAAVSRDDRLPGQCDADERPGQRRGGVRDGDRGRHADPGSLRAPAVAAEHPRRRPDQRHVGRVRAGLVAIWDASLMAVWHLEGGNGGHRGDAGRRGERDCPE